MDQVDRFKAGSLAALHMGLALLSILLAYISISGGSFLDDRWPMILAVLMSAAAMVLNLRASIMFTRALKFENPVPMLQLGSLGFFIMLVFVQIWYLDKVIAAMPEDTPTEQVETTTS